MDTQSSQKMTRYRWTICGMLFLATTINYMDRQVLSLTWKDFIAPDFHWTDADYGNIAAIFGLVYAVANLFSGRFMDWIGVKKGYIWAIAIWSVGACMHALCGLATMWHLGLGSMEQMIAAFTNSQRFGVPVVLKDQKPCLMIQSRDWHIGQPLINWMAPNMLRSQQDREAHAGEDIILLEDDNFRALTKEEGKNIRFDFPACYLKGHELSVGPGSFIWYLNPEAYNKIVQDYEAFKKNGKK